MLAEPACGWSEVCLECRGENGGWKGVCCRGCLPEGLHGETGEVVSDLVLDTRYVGNNNMIIAPGSHEK